MEKLRLMGEMSATMYADLLTYQPAPDEVIRLNIGGRSYRLRVKSVLKHARESLLGRFIRLQPDVRLKWADAYFDDTREYFFERVPSHFDPVYDYFCSGALHVPKDLCFDKFMEELGYWGLSKEIALIL